MSDQMSLLELSELEDDLVPEILPSTASLSIKADVTKLKALFSRASSVTPLKEIIPGTAYALFEALPATSDVVSHLRITASDGEQTVSVVEDGVSVKVPGSVLLPPKRVLDILRLAPTTTVDITVVGSTALVRSGRARWTVQVPVGEINTFGLDEVSGIKLAPVPVVPFLCALMAARKAASTSAARVSLMQVKVKDSAIVACDGGRLHKATVAGLDPAMDTTIPVRTVDELIKALDGADELLMGFDERHLVFRVGADSIVAQRMLLPFPDVQSLLLGPQITNTLGLLVDRNELYEAIKRVRINADPDIAVVTLNIIRGARSADDWALEVRSKDGAGNTAHEVMECQWKGKPKEVSFNHHHLTDLLEVCVADTLILKLGGDTKANRTPLLVDDTDAGVMGIVQQVTNHWQ